MKIKSGEYDILESGTAIQFKEEPIEFELAPNMKIYLRFLTDVKSKEPRMHFKPLENSEAELILYNFNNSTGSGNIEPIALGHIDKRRLYLNFRIYTLDDKQSNRTIHYTWYLGEEVQDG